MGVIEDAQAELARRSTGPQVGFMDAIRQELARRIAPSTPTQGGTVIGTFADNGRVIQNADGTRQAVSAGGATTDPASIDRIMAGDSFAAIVRDSADNQAISQHPIAARAAAFNRGIPFIGEWMDEGIGATFGQQAGDGFNQLSGAMERQRPGQNTALGIAGGVVGTIPMMAAAAPYVTGAATSSLVGQVVRGGIAGAVGGGAEGAVSGYGDQDGSRTGNALVRGAIGAGLGGVIGGAVPAALSGIGNLLQSRAVRNLPNALGISAPAARIVSRVIGHDGPDVAANIAAGGRTSMLADAGPATQSALDYAMQTPSAAARIGRQNIERRASDVMGDLTGTMDNTLGKPQGLISIEDAIRTNARPDIRNAYNHAYGTPIDYASPQGAAIENILSRVPAKTANAAIEQANARMLWANEPNQQIMASIGPNGSVTFQEMPNVRQLDYIKRAFDAMGRDGVNPITGAMTDDARFATGIARAIRNATGEAVPAYRTALSLASDDATQRAAVDFGATILRPNTTREMVERAVKDATKPELRAMGLAVRSQIDETLANVRRIASDPNADLDGRQLAQSLQMLGSDASETKIRSLLGDAAQPLIQRVREAQRALGIKAATTRGSQTAGRQMTQAMVGEELQPGILATIAQGKPINAGQTIIQEMTGFTPTNITARGERILGEVATVLTRAGGPDAFQALKALQAVSDATPLDQKTAYQVARAFTAALAAGTHQQGAPVVESRLFRPQ